MGLTRLIRFERGWVNLGSVAKMCHIRRDKICEIIEQTVDAYEIRHPHGLQNAIEAQKDIIGDKTCVFCSNLDALKPVAVYEDPDNIYVPESWGNAIAKRRSGHL